MKVDGHLGFDLKAVPGRVRALEELGFDGVRSAEMNHDPFFPLLLAAEHSEKLEIATSIAVAFARSPMILAGLGHDLNAYSGGRFTLGLGSQIKPHITKRFSMQWGAPAKQMRELILAMRAIWANWYEGEPLRFEGEYYTHTLMTPAFTPQDGEHGAPRVILAAVGPKMTEVAAETADGMIVHPFSNETYLRTVTIPAIDAALGRVGKTRDEFELSWAPFVVSGRDEAEFERNRVAACNRIAFYGSTPAYREVLECIGYGEMQGVLNRLSKEGKWKEMGELIDDEILGHFAVVGEPSTIVPEILRRYGDLIDRTSAAFEFADPDVQADMIARLRAA